MALMAGYHLQCREDTKSLVKNKGLGGGGEGEGGIFSVLFCCCLVVLLFVCVCVVLLFICWAWFVLVKFANS